MSLRLLSCALLVSCSMAAAADAVSDLVARHNVMVFSDFHATNGRILGPLVAGRDVRLVRSSVGGTHLESGAYAVVAGRHLELSSSPVLHGNTYAGQATSLVSLVTPHVSIRGGASPVDVAWARHAVRRRSAEWAAMPDTGSVQADGPSLLLQSSHPRWAVFTLPASQLADARAIRLACAPSAYVLINLTGLHARTPDALPAWNGTPLPNAPWAAGRILYHYPDATRVHLSGHLVGTVVAPHAAVSAGGGVLVGSLVAESYEGSTLFLHRSPVGDLPVPEATRSGLLPQSAFAVVGIVLLSAVPLRRTRRIRLVLRVRRKGPCGRLLSGVSGHLA